MRWAIIQIPSMAIDGPSMPIGKSCDGHRWAIDGPIDGIEWSLSTGCLFYLFEQKHTLIIFHGKLVVLFSDMPK